MKTFEAWLAEYNRACIALCGMDADCLDDMPTARWYEQGVSPKTAAKRAIRWTQRGYRPDFAD
jgi:hypothetical protein